jgi:hypothetical protein
MAVALADAAVNTSTYRILTVQQRKSITVDPTVLYFLFF